MIFLIYGNYTTDLLLPISNTSLHKVLMCKNNSYILDDEHPILKYTNRSDENKNKD